MPSIFLSFKKNEAEVEMYNIIDSYPNKSQFIKEVLLGVRDFTPNPLSINGGKEKDEKKPIHGEVNSRSQYDERNTGKTNTVDENKIQETKEEETNNQLKEIEKIKEQLLEQLLEQQKLLEIQSKELQKVNKQNVELMSNNDESNKPTTRVETEIKAISDTTKSLLDVGEY